MTGYYAEVHVLAREIRGLRARLTEADSGAPVVGQLVVFEVNSDQAFLCQAYTDANGFAECNAPLPGPLTLVQLTLGGYRAQFDGSPDYLPAEATNSVGYNPIW
jgi:hypothetical protein